LLFVICFGAWKIKFDGTECLIRHRKSKDWQYNGNLWDPISMDF
jgi:hypothetical protein